MKAIALLATFAVLSGPAFATVTLEFQLGGVSVPSGSTGILVADAAGNGFTSPFTSGGTTLAAGQKIGPDDTIVGVFNPSTLGDFSSGKGFAALLSGIDYPNLGLGENMPLMFYVFPERAGGQTLRAGEPHVAYTTTSITPNSTMGFALPRDGGSYLLAALGTEVGGSADLSPVDISLFNHNVTGSPVNRSLTSSAEHSYYFEVTSPGLLNIEGTGQAGLRAALYGPDGTLIASADGSGNFTFEEELALGFHTLVLFRDSGGPTTLSYFLEVTDADGGVVIPDVSVGSNAVASIGNNRYAGAAGQLVSLTSRQARPVTGYARIGNDGDRPESLAVRGSGGNSFCRINFLGASGNVTTSVTTGRLRTPQITSANSPLSLRVQFIPNKKKLVKKRGRRTVTTRRTFTSSIRATTTTPGVIASPDAASVRVLTR